MRSWRPPALSWWKPQPPDPFSVSNCWGEEVRRQGTESWRTEEPYPPQAVHRAAAQQAKFRMATEIRRKYGTYKQIQVTADTSKVWWFKVRPKRSKRPSSPKQGLTERTVGGQTQDVKQKRDQRVKGREGWNKSSRQDQKSISQKIQDILYMNCHSQNMWYICHH